MIQKVFNKCNLHKNSNNNNDDSNCDHVCIKDVSPTEIDEFLELCKKNGVDPSTSKGTISSTELKLNKKKKNINRFDSDDSDNFNDSDDGYDENHDPDYEPTEIELEHDEINNNDS